MNYTGRVVVWISNTTLGHEVSTELARKLSTGDISSKCEVYMMPTDVNKQLSLDEDDTVLKPLRYADILVMGDKVVPVDKVNTFALERSFFSFGYSKYKRSMMFASSINGEYDSIVRKGRELNSKDIINKYFSSDSIDVDQVFSLVADEIDHVINLYEIDKATINTFGVGVAIELLKGGLHTISKQSWEGSKYLVLSHLGSSHIRVVCPDEDTSKAWIPEPSDLMDEDYFSIRG